MNNSSVIHLCLVSDQPVPSITPLIDPELGVRQVILVAGPERVLAASRLASALQKHDIRVEIIPLRSSLDLNLIRQDLEDLARERPPLYVNITGGSKVMTIAAWECFRRPGDRIYYVNIMRDSIDWLWPESSGCHAISNTIRLEGYLAAHGVGLVPHKPPNRKLPGGELRRLALAAMDDPKLRKGFRYMRQALNGVNNNDPFEPNILGPANSQRIIDPLVRAGLLKWTKWRKLRITSHTSRSWIYGGWLEDGVRLLCSELGNSDSLIQDVAGGFEIIWPMESEEPLKNEIDVACLRDNTLYLIECKTGGRYGIKGRGAGANNFETIYKLEAIAELIGGLRGRSLLVVTQSPKPHFIRYAKAIGIDLLSLEENHSARDLISAWLNRPYHYPSGVASRTT